MKRITLFMLILIYSPLFAQVLKVEKETVVHEKLNLEKEEIGIYKDVDIGSILFKEIPEISISRKGIFVSEIFLRGFGRENINVLIDGTRVYGACPNGMDTPPFFIRSSNIKGIKLVEGVEDIQNQGSLGGSVQILTEEPEIGKTFFELSTTSGSFGYSTLNLSANLKNLLFSFISEYGKPYETGEGKNVTEYPQGSAAYQDRYINKKALDLKETDIKFKTDNLFVSATYFNANSVLYPYLLMDSLRDENKRLNIRYIYKPEKVRFNLYYSSMEHDMRDTYRKSAIDWTNGVKSSRGYMMRTVATSKVYGIKIIKDWKNVETGIETFKRNWNADNELMMIKNSGMIPDVNSFSFGIFASLKKSIKSYSINTGIRFDHVSSRADLSKMGENRNLYSSYYNEVELDTEFNYLSGYIKGEKKLSRNLKAGLSIGQSIRFPNPQELFIALIRPMSKPNWVGNPLLKPTKNREIKIEAEWRGFTGKIDGYVFYSDLKDYIYLTRIDGIKPAMSYKNIDAYIYGGSVSSIFIVGESLFLKAGISYQRGKKKEGLDKDLAEIPPLKLLASLTYEKGDLSFIIEDIYSSKQENVDSQLNEVPTDSWNVVNLKLKYQKSSIGITVGVDNLFDEFYYQHLSYLRNPFSTGTKVPESGRFLYLNMNLTF